MRNLNLVLTFSVMLWSMVISPVNSKMLDRHEINQENFNTKFLSKSKSSGNLLLDIIYKLFAPSSRSGGSRGDDSVCANSPSFDNAIPYLWTRQPLLMWSGSASSLKVIDFQSGQIFWQKSIDSKLKFGKVRIEKPLITGRKYIWQVIFSSNNDDINPSISFQMVSSNQHQKTKITLEKLEKQLAVKESSSEEIIFAKAKYFADQKMWGDVQELLAMIPQSSPQYKKAIETLGEMQKSLGICLQTTL
jgi:hypothetical protein